MNSKILRFNESEACKECKDEYEKGIDCELKVGNYIVCAGEYKYIDDSKVYDLTNLYFQRSDFNRYINSEDVVRVESKPFSIYKVANPIRVKIIKECKNININHHDLTTGEYTSFDYNNIEKYLSEY